MTFETLAVKLDEAKQSVSQAYHQLAMAESMATVRPCPLVEKSIAAVESALDRESIIRQQMGEVITADWKALGERAGI